MFSLFRERPRQHEFGSKQPFSLTQPLTAAGSEAGNGYQSGWTPIGTFEGKGLTDAESFGGSLVQTVTINTEGTSNEVPLVPDGARRQTPAARPRWNTLRESCTPPSGFLHDAQTGQWQVQFHLMTGGHDTIVASTKSWQRCRDPSTFNGSARRPLHY
jgi:hypothetical protein